MNTITLDHIRALEHTLFKLECVLDNPNARVSSIGSIVLEQQWHTVAHELAHLSDLIDVYCLGQPGHTKEQR